MSDSPNIWSSTATPGSRPASMKSVDSPPAESTPLLARSNSHDGEDGPSSTCSTSSRRSRRSHVCDGEDGLKKRFWQRRPVRLVLLLLLIDAILIIALFFVLPATVEDYAKEAIVFTPENLAVNTFTSEGVIVDVKGLLSVDASRVRNAPTRNIGRFATWFVSRVKSGEADVEFAVPDLGDMVLVTATIPPLSASIYNGHDTFLNFQSLVRLGGAEGLKKLANDYFKGNLHELVVEGRTAVPLTVGFVPIGRKSLSKLLRFNEDQIPSIPPYTIEKLYIHEMDLPNAPGVLAVETTLNVENAYPVELKVPPLGFRALVENCSPDEPPIAVADAATHELMIEPKRAAHVSATGLIKQLPDALLSACPDSKESPLDSFLGNYLHGQDAKLYVQGAGVADDKTPQWISDFMSNVTVAVPFPGHSYDDLIKKFSLSDVEFELPDQTAPPDSPAAKPQVSGNVEVLVALPKEMNFNLDVQQIRADADIYYKGRKMGVLNIRKWQNATSSPPNGTDKGNSLMIKSHIQNAPLDITDQDVFTEVVQALIFGGKDVVLQVKADVDVKLKTTLGEFAVKKIPAQGDIPVKPISHGGYESLMPSLTDLNIHGYKAHALAIEANINFTNPTNYSATVPFFDINILTNGTLLGNATVENVSVVPGRNENVHVRAKWDPLSLSGESGVKVGRELLSQYVSGFNTTITLRTHEGTVPALPKLGRMLERFEFNMTTPKLKLPGSPDDGDGDDEQRSTRFIKGATMHLLSSTASFTLASPLPATTLFITELHATAYHRDDGNDDDGSENIHIFPPFSHSEDYSLTASDPLTAADENEDDGSDGEDDPYGSPIGTIDHSLPFAVPPGISVTPRLPVVWSVGSVGYDAVKQALGGSLKLSTRARVKVRLGAWEEELWFVGRGIGAGVRL